jgi:hypothetical protein
MVTIQITTLQGINKRTIAWKQFEIRSGAFFSFYYKMNQVIVVDRNGFFKIPIFRTKGRGSRIPTQ